MRIKILEWLRPDQTLSAPAIAFGFDSVEELVKGQLTLSWLNAGGHPVKAHNLVIVGWGSDAETLGRAVIEAGSKPFPKFRKGRLSDGTARDVYPILNDPALPFRAGLTVHAARGTWSSLPHKFEAVEILNSRPMPFYERFAYVTDPPGGGGYQVRIGHLYSESLNDFPPEEDDIKGWVNDVVAIRDRDIIDIPLGSHPVTGGPGVRLCYLWCYWTDPALPWVMTLREKF